MFSVYRGAKITGNKMYYFRNVSVYIKKDEKSVGFGLILQLIKEEKRRKKRHLRQILQRIKRTKNGSRKAVLDCHTSGRARPENLQRLH